MRRTRHASLAERAESMTVQLGVGAIVARGCESVDDWVRVAFKSCRDSHSGTRERLFGIGV